MCVACLKALRRIVGTAVYVLIAPFHILFRHVINEDDDSASVL